METFCNTTVVGDRIGSSSWITYSDGKAVEHLHYMPWGEDFVRQRNTDFHARYTFSAKEKDAETGYSYFGARYYSSDLGIWLSVDPMSDKYPSLSPYAYCADNPVKLVDPNGEEWYVNEDGYIKGGDNDDDHNVYFVEGQKDNFGKNLTDSKRNMISIDIGDDMDRGICEENRTFNNNDHEEPYTAHYFKITNLKTAQKLFKYMSRYTDVEWSFWGGDEEKDYNLSTSHITWTDIYGGNMALQYSKGGKLSFFIHSHPRNESLGMFVNDVDRKMQAKCLEGSPDAVIGIMHNGTLYDFNVCKIDWDGKRR